MGSSPEAPRSVRLGRALAGTAVILGVCGYPAAAPAAPEPDGDPVVAEYRGGEIRASELEAWRRYRRPNLDRPPGEALRRRLTRSLVALRLEEARFAAAGLDRSPDYEVWRRLLQARQGAEALAAAVGEAAGPAEDEIRAAYDRDPERFRSPARWRLANLFKRFPDDAGGAERGRLRAEMEALRKRLLAGEDFGRLAEAESESTSRARGGRIGWVELDRLRDPMRKVVAALSPGEVTPVLETEDGLTILRCDRFHPATVESYADARDRLERRLAAEIARNALDALDRELRAAARPVLRPVAVVGNGGEPPVEWHAGHERRRLDRLDVALFLRDRGWRDAAAVPAEVLERLLEERLALELRAEEAARRDLLDRAAHRERRRWAERELRAELWVLHELDARLAPIAPAEVRAAYAARPEVYREPERLELRAVALAIDPDRPRELYQRARELGERLASGKASFDEAVAALVPPAELRELGSLTGQEVWRLGLNTELALADLAPGGTTELVQEGRTLYLFHLLSRQPSRTLTFEEARAGVERNLRARRSRRERQRMRRELLEAAAIRAAAGSGTAPAAAGAEAP